MVGDMLRGLTVFAICLVAAMLPAEPAVAQAGFAVDTEASCTSSSCHTNLGKQKFVHEPAAANGEQCVVCHQTRREGRHGFEIAAEEGELCAFCHEDMAEREFAHVPVAEGLCSFCHDPHQTENPKQLYFPPNSELCFSCHDDQPFKNVVTHGPVQEGACLKCHDPHSSDHYSQLKAEPPELCFQCHNRTQKDHEGKRLPSPKPAFDSQALNRHAPFEAGDCVTCHTPHAGPNYRLLMAPYPKGLYASFSPDKYVCFMCHDEEAFAKPRTLTDTNFRNGNLNLHYRHVNRDKGRGCKACHHHHAAANEKLIRDVAPFGKRAINISKFQLTEDGATCAPTCHRQVTYDRYEPVDNKFRVTPREGADATPDELQRAKREQLGE